MLWLSSKDNQTQLDIGQIIGTSKLYVKFESVSSSKPTRIFITAEVDETTQDTSRYIVLETNKF